MPIATARRAGAATISTVNDRTMSKARFSITCAFDKVAAST